MISTKVLYSRSIHEIFRYLVQTPYLPQVFPLVRHFSMIAGSPSIKSCKPEEPRVQLIAYSRRETQSARF